MTCPNCGARIPANAAFCTSCGAALNPPSDGTTIPLTPAQQQSLRVMLWLPTAVGALVVGGFCLIGSCIALTWPGSVLAPWIAGVVLVLFVLAIVGVMALHVRNVRADLASGMAQVRVDRLVRTLRKRSSGETVSYSYYAVFERDGRVIIDRQQYAQLQPGVRYRVVLSPRVNRAWTIEPVAEP